jgi:two-component sensor histidine kinase
VDVRWRCAPAHGEHRVQLLWCEAKGPTVRPSGQTGTGTSLLERMVGRVLGGSVVTRFEADGLRCGIDFPLLSASKPLDGMRFSA